MVLEKDIQTELRTQEVENKEYINQFCEKFGVKLVKTDYTTENGEPEPMYVFNDGLGGYTIEGIRNSLTENTE